MKKFVKSFSCFFNDTPTEIKYWGGGVVTQKAGDNMEVEVSILFLVKKK